jgi:hypothetical protein
LINIIERNGRCVDFQAKEAKIKIFYTSEGVDWDEILIERKASYCMQFGNRCSERTSYSRGGREEGGE